MRMYTFFSHINMKGKQKTVLVPTEICMGIMECLLVEFVQN